MPLSLDYAPLWPSSGFNHSFLCLSFAYSELDIWIPQPFHADVPTDWWDLEADKSLLIGVFKHGKLRLLTADTLWLVHLRWQATVIANVDLL